MKKIMFLAILQIFLLVNLTIAQSDLIAASSGIENKKIINLGVEKFLEKGIGFLFWITSLDKFAIVSAEDEVNLGCCLETSVGGICQPFAFTSDPSTCTGGLIQADCSETEECQPGCCISPEGNCATNSPKKACEENGGTFESGTSCEISECQDACCILGDSYYFRNENECNYLSSQEGIEKEFRVDIESELNCLALQYILDNGACVSEGGCIQTTGEECINRDGRFYAGEFCTNEELELEWGYDYESHADKTCYKEDIYWEDSEGNIEEIETDCVEGIERCSLEGNNYVCKDLGCADPNFMLRYGRNPINGESWCIYEGAIGNGQDTVGSEHWFAGCADGEVNSEKSYDLSGPYRGKLCAESKSEIADTGEFFISAGEVTNLASQCISYNQEFEGTPALKTNCEKNTHCYYKTLNLGGGEKINLCLPSYPRGASQEEENSVACGMASIKIPVVYKKNNRLDDWDCESNCNVETPEFIKSMNDFCVSLGDCGAYVNYLGEGINNFNYQGKRGYKLDDDGNEDFGEGSGYSGCDSNNAGDANCQRVHWQDYSERGIVNPVQIAKSPFIVAIASALNIELDNNFGDLSPEAKLLFLGKISGGIGGLGLALNWVGETFYLGNAFNGAMGTIASGGMGFSLGFYAGSLIADWAGVSGPAATASAIGGGISGAAAFLADGWTGFLGSTFFWVGVGVILVSILVGGPSYESRYIEFTCDPWTAPQGGEDCERCNEDPMKPCTKYRCESLGTMCDFINEDTENPPCVPIEEELNPPVISEGIILTEGYEFQDATSGGVKVRTTDGECLEQGKEVLIRLFTDEKARCKFSTEIPAVPQYEEMVGDLTLERTYWRENHTIAYVPPRVDSLPAVDIDGSIPNRIGNQNLYIKCTDRQDPSNFNFNNYIVDICINEKDTTQVDFGQARAQPNNGATLTYGLEEQEVKIWIPEAADCKYSNVSGKDYFEMENEFSCAGLGQKELWGYPCTTTLTNLHGGENSIYIKCLDQPWLDENDSLRKLNDEDWKYSLYGSESALNITSVTFTYDGKTISSGNSFKEGFEPIEVEMKVITIGGSDSGESACNWKLNEGDSGSLMKPWGDYSTSHSQFLNYILRGTTNAFISCEDSAGNIAETIAELTLEVDNTPPHIVRAYNKNGKLQIITNEQATCYYDFSTCNFNIENATDMTAATSTKHSASWIPGQTYYIKCEDLWENKNPRCAIKITPEY